MNAPINIFTDEGGFMYLPPALGFLNSFFSAAPPTPSSSIIQSIQQIVVPIGSGATTGTQAITPVTISNTVLWWNGYTASQLSNASFNTYFNRVNMTDSATVQATRGTASTATVSAHVTVVEFISSAIVSIQSGVVSVVAFSASSVITAVDTSKSVVFWQGETTAASDNFPGRYNANIILADSTHVIASRLTNPGLATSVGWAVVNFSGSVISSVQPVSLTLTSANATDTATLTTVSTNNSCFLWNGITISGTTLAAASAWTYRFSLTDSVTATFARRGNDASTRILNGTVVEFNSGILNQAIQRGTLLVSGTITANATITTVSTAKAVCNWNGFTNSSTGNLQAKFYLAEGILTATSIQGELAGAIPTDAGYEVVEFM